MQTSLTAALARLAELHTRATERRTRQNYAEDTHFALLSFDLRHLLTDVDDSILGEPNHRPPPDRSRLTAVREALRRSP
jgi:hypothetical protein